MFFRLLYRADPQFANIVTALQGILKEGVKRNFSRSSIAL